jgi:DNA primase catalytic core
MATRAMSFPDAVEFLAGRFGIELKYDGNQQAGPRVDREKLFSLCSVAHNFFRRTLLEVKGGAGEFQRVGEYLRKRDLTVEAINVFGIGYCPNQRGLLLDALKKAGFDLETILLSGLVRRSSSGDLYELFRGRLIFPIYVDAKRIAGFGGRIIPGVVEPSYEKQSPKYVNSPETPIYQKSKTFYGLPQALKAIRDAGEAYVVEGYMDVIGLAMRGVKNVVACCGTALTEQHLRRFSGICSRVHLLFDGDEAGRAAAAKSFNTAKNAELDVTACFLPDDVDPDDFARTHHERTPEALAELPKALLIDVYVDHLMRSNGCKSGEHPGPNLLGSICEEIAGALRGVNREVVLASLVSRAAKKLRIENTQLEKLLVREQRGAGVLKDGATASPDRGGSRTDPAAHHRAEEGAVKVTGTAPRPPSQLPKADQDLLRVVVVMRDAAIREVVNNPDVCEIVSPEAMSFILALQEIVSGTDEDLQKTKIREYLQALGPEWVSLWKEAFAINSKSGQDVEETYKKTLIGFRRSKLQQLIRECQNELAHSADDPQRQAEVFDQMRSLKSQLDSLLRG